MEYLEEQIRAIVRSAVVRSLLGLVVRRLLFLAGPATVLWLREDGDDALDRV